MEFSKADYSAIELRLLASMADASQPFDIHEPDVDSHVLTAMKEFGVKKEDVTPEMRSKAKLINFHKIYGGVHGQLNLNTANVKTGRTSFKSPNF